MNSKFLQVYVCHLYGLVCDAYIAYCCLVEKKVKKFDADNPVQAVHGEGDFNYLHVESGTHVQDGVKNGNNSVRNCDNDCFPARRDGDDMHSGLPEHCPEEN